MFTGLIEFQGRVASLQSKGSNAELWLESDELSRSTSIGDSIAVSGVCLTVVETKASLLKFEISAESLEKSNLGFVREGEILNLEPALSLGKGLGGHIVQGHVDACAEVSSIEANSDHHILRLRFRPKEFAYLVEKASVCLNGISLTVNECLDNCEASFNIVPHTWNNSDIRFWKLGQKVNVEIDILAKYVFQFAQKLPQRSSVG